jgi:hypothetical protein
MSQHAGGSADKDMVFYTVHCGCLAMSNCVEVIFSVSLSGLSAYWVQLGLRALFGMEGLVILDAG